MNVVYFRFWLKMKMFLPWHLQLLYVNADIITQMELKTYNGYTSILFK